MIDAGTEVPTTTAGDPESLVIEQLLAKPMSPNVCLPGVSLVNSRENDVIDETGPSRTPSTTRVYPSGSRSGPVVRMVSSTSPVTRVQLTCTVSLRVSPEGISTFRESWPEVQTGGSSLMTSRCEPGASES